MGRSAFTTVPPNRDKSVKHLLFFARDSREKTRKSKFVTAPDRAANIHHSVVCTVIMVNDRALTTKCGRNLYSSESSCGRNDPAGNWTWSYAAGFVRYAFRSRSGNKKEI